MAVRLMLFGALFGLIVAAGGVPAAQAAPARTAPESASLMLAATPDVPSAATGHSWKPKEEAVPGVAPQDAPAATYLDQNGRVLSMSGVNADVAGSAQAPAVGCTPVSGRDNPHYTAPDVSGHGWWKQGTCSAATATVFNCLYEYYTDNTYRQKAYSPKKSLKPGSGGSAARTNARVRCDSTAQSSSWRNHVDVDVDGQVDTGEQPYRQADVKCVVN